jgi:hypothetical protein
MDKGKIGDCVHDLKIFFRPHKPKIIGSNPITRIFIFKNEKENEKCLLKK